jgi:hypothetical protein
MKIKYVQKNFRQDALDIIRKAEIICDEYESQGYILTLRQLYYQFVARGYIANKDSEYKRLGGIVNDARLAGLIDWDRMEDRTRNLQSLSVWNNPSEIMGAVAKQYREALWNDQPYYVEVWVEKEALAGVIQRTAEDLLVSFFSCRGYVSQSEMHATAQRLRSKVRKGQRVVIVHLGDHDPSGLDMTRDIIDRMALFGADVAVDRIALNMDQVREFNPPPNPAKITDTRAFRYIEEYGEESWELDALPPDELDRLIRLAVEPLRDEDTWEESKARQDLNKSHLALCSDNWGDVSDFLKENYA